MEEQEKMSDPVPLKILWLKTGPLFPLDTGGKKRTYAMLKDLGRRNAVTYVSLLESGAKLEPEEEADGYAQRKIWVPWREARKGSIRFYGEIAANFIFSTLPYALAKYRSRGLAEKLAELMAGERFDVVVCDFLAPALNLGKLFGRPGAPLVLFQHNMEAQIWKRMAEGKRGLLARIYWGIQARRMVRWEAHLSWKFDAVITVSPEDSTWARQVYGLQNVLGDVPTGVDLDYFREVAEAGRESGGYVVGFLGSMDWMPNIEGLLWFHREVWPEVRRRVPGCRLLVIGRRPPPAVRKLAERDEDIEVTGTVEDVRPSLQRCHAMVVPLLSGGGTRIKIMEALAAGVPVVSTRVGAEGLGLEDGEQILIADAAGAFAEAVSRLAGEPGLRRRLAEAGARRVGERHSWETVTAEFEALLRRALGGEGKSGGKAKVPGGEATGSRPRKSG